jgi:ubiquitin carboxyl-terminal hydrolase 25/28
MEREKYVLHAIICHMGQRATSGHYWVWIYDFAARVWRKYNDTTVTERAESETATVLAELSAAGEPYYIAYVRDEDKENLVSVPPRVIEVGAEPEGEKMDVDGAM